MKCFNQESVLHVRLEQTVQDRAVGIERRFIRQVAHGVPVPQELQLGREFVVRLPEAQHFSGRIDRLRQAVARLGGTPTDGSGDFSTA